MHISILKIKGDGMLKIKELYSGYNGVDIIKNVNLQVDKGEILFIIGPNGCGKSTLLNIICGKEGHDEGKVYLDSSYFH